MTLCEYIHLEYVRIHVIYRVNQAEYVIQIRAVAPQECVNIYSTPRVSIPSAQATLHLGRRGDIPGPVGHYHYCV